MENWRGGLRTSWYSSDRGSGTSALLIWTNQPIHLFLVGCLNPCLQETNVQVVSPPAPTFDHIEIGSSFLYIFSYAIEQTARIPGKLDVVDHFARFEVQPYPEPHHRLVFNLHINNVIKLRARCCFFLVVTDCPLDDCVWEDTWKSPKSDEWAVMIHHSLESNNSSYGYALRFRFVVSLSLSLPPNHPDRVVKGGLIRSSELFMWSRLPRCLWGADREREPDRELGQHI